MRRTISLAGSCASAYDRADMSDGIEIRDRVDDGAVIVRLFEGAGNGVVATLAYTGEVMDIGVLALDAEGCDELVRALGYDVTDDDAPEDWSREIAELEAQRDHARAELAEREATCSQRYAEIQRLKREIAYLAACPPTIMYVTAPPAPMPLTPETCDRLADACRSGRGEQSISRNHACARAALQQAADWLRRAEAAR